MSKKINFDRKALFWTLIGFNLGCIFMLLMIGQFLMKYKIQWQDRWGNWQHYQTKHNEADAYRVMKQMVKQKGIRHRIVDENNSLIDLLSP